MTPAQKRALQAVRDGQCFRRYHATGRVVYGTDPAELNRAIAQGINQYFARAA